MYPKLLFYFQTYPHSTSHKQSTLHFISWSSTITQLLQELWNDQITLGGDGFLNGFLMRRWRQVIDGCTGRSIGPQFGWPKWRGKFMTCSASCGARQEESSKKCTALYYSFASHNKEVRWIMSDKKLDISNTRPEPTSSTLSSLSSSPLVSSTFEQENKEDFATNNLEVGQLLNSWRLFSSTWVKAVILFL